MQYTKYRLKGKKLYNKTVKIDYKDINPMANKYLEFGFHIF